MIAEQRGSKKVSYSPHPKAEKRLRSASCLVRMLLFERPAEAVPEHVRELLTILLWKVTEADGKFSTRYRTQAAVECNDVRGLRHEHVYQRTKMIDALLCAKAEEVDIILSQAVGCVVTVDEHLRLATFDDAYGWDRYRLAEIEVLDMTTMQAKVF